MKKSVLALSIAAAVSGLGYIPTASAIGEVAGADLNTRLVLNADGLGHVLVVPYFSAQGDNATLLSITNTDTVNGKLVKVRFRGAGNSDDLFDFQVLMSPGDMWTGAVSQDAASGLAKMVTSDKTCTLPASVNQNFVIARTDPQKNRPNETREGYVEIFAMADVPPRFGAAGIDTLYEAIKHVNGVAPCTPAILEATLGTEPQTLAIADARGFIPPTGGLTGDWIIINQQNTAAWSGADTALEVRGNDGNGAAARGNLVFWPQKATPPVFHARTPAAGQLPLIQVTADPLLLTGVVPVQQFDLPDLSTPYATADRTAGVNDAGRRALNLSDQLAVTSITNQFVTNTGIAGVTDFLFSQPSRRYHTAVNYVATSAAAPTSTGGTTAVALYRDENTNAVGTAATNRYYSPANTILPAAIRQVCVNNIAGPGPNTYFDREEGTPGVSATQFVISPNVPEAPTSLLFCGETSIVSINGGSTTAPSALRGSVARADVTPVGFTAPDGWLTLNTANGGPGFPIIGSAFIRAANGAVNYGFAYPHKVR